jgi:hypothetical protein
MKSFKDLKSKMNSKYYSGIKNAKIFFLFVSVLIFFSIASISFAESLIFAPASGSYTKGSYITVTVLVSSPDKIMNAASGVISFPTDLLSVTSISKSGSIVGFWAQDPSYSNSDGVINFEGVVLPPWYKGSSGKLLTITFKAKASGTANLSFSSGSVLAADGSGTDITSGLGSASFDISSAGEAPVTMQPAELSGVPSAPAITSDTHPDQTKWYTLSDADFSWMLTKDITGASILIGRNKIASPTVLYDPPISSKQVKNLDDGVWYFHAQLRNDNGWGDIGTYKIQIDTEKPTSFDIAEIKRSDLTDPSAKFTFNAVDKTSGIDHYEVQIDNNAVETWKDGGSHIYTASAQEDGTHTLLAKVFDKAGNFLANSVQFSVQGLEAPIITNYPTEIQSGDIITLSGTSKYSGAEADLFLQDEKGTVKNYTSKVDKDGNFTSISDRLKDGLYTAWVKIIDSRGATSLPSNKVTIAVRQSAIIKIGTWAVSLLAVMVPLLALIILLIFLLWYAWHKFFIIGDKLKKETREAEDALHKAFDLLKESVAEQVKILEKVKTKRQLTEEEEKINRQLKKDLEDAEAYIRKEIEDIEDLVNKKK